MTDFIIRVIIPMILKIVHTLSSAKGLMLKNLSLPLIQISGSYEPSREKPACGDVRPGKAQTGLLSYC